MAGFRAKALLALVFLGGEGRHVRDLRFIEDSIPSIMYTRKRSEEVA